MGSDFKAYQTKKAQLLTEIEYLIDELKYLQRAGENSQTVPIARQLETKLQHLSALRTTKRTSNLPRSKDEASSIRQNAYCLPPACGYACRS